ncbi:hypothetical protein AVEN_200769-1 [Araneus ventricosus]|uniref:HAT C-terminal dimerisation domain-containing protein n=1 Tax=Araneus ventricosus TaxID=182803 RepID=A0A4Y2DVZ9_ARAVE|nr:hypothetical protein AVEN_200769-1 [Araneus ventricosus]
MACAILACFHGHKVESSFSIMNSVVTSKRNRLSVESFDAIQTVKYELMSEKKSAVELYRKDYLKDKVDRNLCKTRIQHQGTTEQKFLAKKKKIFVTKSQVKEKANVKGSCKENICKSCQIVEKYSSEKMRSQVSKNPCTSESCTQNQAVCCTNMTDDQKQTMNCQLSHVNERPVKKQKAGNVSEICCKGPLTLKEMFAKIC